MLIVNADALKKFLIENLSKLSNADPEALTKYVMALLKKKRPESELRKFLLDQLDVFLQRETASFVDLLLQTLKTKSYIEKFCDVDDSKTNYMSRKVPEVSSVRKDCKTKTVKESNSNMKKKTKPERPPSSSETAHSCSISPSASKHEKTGDLNHKSRELNAMKVVNELPVSETSNNCKKRCEDYDLRGYCLKGALCQFDHGCDPILVEDVSSLNFTVRPDLPIFEGKDVTGNSESPPPLPTTPPPPLPPLPPILDVTLCQYAEPYNPESPGMGSYSPMFMNNLPSSTSEPESVSNVFKTFHSVPHRNRMLVGVPTVNSDSVCNINNVKSDFANSSQDAVLKRKGIFDFSRLGNPKKLAKTTSILELRKVPEHLNNIAMLNSHFSKFGRIVNLEVGYENDPEAALVKFKSPMEAENAYRSKIAIFNNRFIKVFYHKQDKGDCPVIIENGKEEISEVIPEKSTEHIHMKYASTHIKKGNVSRTVYIPKCSPQSPESHSREVKKLNDRKYVSPLEKQLELLRRKQSLLKSSIDHEKKMLAMLLKTKNKKEADFLKKTIESISCKISELKSEIQNESEELKRKLTGRTSMVNRSEKELLDAEMDLYREKAKVSFSYSEIKETALLNKVKELKQKAKSLGLLDGSSALDGPKHGREVKQFACVSHPRQILVGENPSSNDDHFKNYEVSSEILGDEEEDEDTETRSWRH